MTTTHRCLEIAIPERSPRLEAMIEEAIWAMAPGGFERQDDDTPSLLVDDPRPREPGTVRWRAYGAIEDGDFITALTDALPRDARIATADWELDNTGFVTSWQAYFKRLTLTERVEVYPPWDPPVAPLPVSIQITPAMAFGTGTHETTQLCVRALDALLDSASVTSLFDVGTGSAILAMVAAQLGVPRVVGVDIDADAIASALENVEDNDLSAKVEVSTTPADEVSGTFDLVVANMLPHILLSVQDALVTHIAPGGHLLLSGIQHFKEAEVRTAFEATGLEVVDRFELGEWCALYLAR